MKALPCSILLLILTSAELFAAPDAIPVAAPLPSVPTDPIIVLMLGPPGAGKGTQAERLAAKLGVPTISVGALLRAARLNEAERQAQAKGELLADTTVMRILGEELFRSPGDLR